MLVFSGTSHSKLAKEIVDCLGIQLSVLELGKFPDNEISLHIPETVRGQDVFVVQSIALDPNNYLVELLIIVDALKRASARSITAVIPYFGYCRQDRKDKPREPITAKLIADLISVAGTGHILTMDLHAGQLEGFFNIPVDHLHALPTMISAINQLKLKNCVVVAPDVGSVKRARAYAKSLKADFAVVDKRRLTAHEVESISIIGNVQNKDVLLADDMCSTAGTLVSAAKACREKGASRIFAVATHGLLVGDAIERIEESPIEALYISNTIPNGMRLSNAKKIRLVSIAEPFAHAIRCIAMQEPIHQ